MDQQSSEAYILNLTKYLKTIRGSVSKSMFPNKAYGISDNKNSHPEKTTSFFNDLCELCERV